MRHRYDHWVEGLNGDWLISRQRFFGVPIPLWYPVDADGEADHDHPIAPTRRTLPIDPSADVPPGYTADQRGQPGGFVGDPDIMDTWATSSLTPQIAGRWVDDPELFARVFPMDLRPQGPEIIRTWLFATVVRSHYEHGSLPWANTMINGWILDPDRKKMSKSKGNVVTPMALFERTAPTPCATGRSSARPGVDTAFSEDQMKVGRRLATKLLNVTKFVLRHRGDDARRRATPSTDPVDRGDARPPRRHRCRGDHGVRRVRLRPGARAHRGVLLVVLRRLRRAGEEPGVRRPRRRGRGVGVAGAARSPSTRCSGCSPRSCPSRPKRCGAGGTTRACTPPRGRRPAASPTPASLDASARCSARVRRAKTEAKVSQRADRRHARPSRASGVARRARSGARRPRRGAHRRRARARRAASSSRSPTPTLDADGAVTPDRRRRTGSRQVDVRSPPAH